MFPPPPPPRVRTCPSTLALLGTWFCCCFLSAIINVSSFRKWSVTFISESRTVPGPMLWWFSQSGSSANAEWINEWMHTFKWIKITYIMFPLKTFTSSELSLKKSLRIRNRSWKLLECRFFFPLLLLQVVDLRCLHILNLKEILLTQTLKPCGITRSFVCMNAVFWWLSHGLEEYGPWVEIKWTLFSWLGVCFRIKDYFLTKWYRPY